jgi:hypothetical protein
VSGKGWYVEMGGEGGYIACCFEDMSPTPEYDARINYFPTITVSDSQIAIIRSNSLERSEFSKNHRNQHF